MSEQTAGGNVTCRSEVRRGDDWHASWEPCGKRAKGTLASGEPACGTHLAVERREAEKNAVRQDYKNRKALVSEVLGIPVWGWEINGHLTVSVALSDLEAVAKRIGRPDGGS